MNMKTSPELRARIEKAARESGLSMAQEVERRVLASIEADDAAGGSHNAALLRLMSAAIEMAENRAGARWTKDLRAWAAVKHAVSAIVDANEPALPKDVQDAWRDADKADAKVAESGSTGEKLMLAGGHSPARDLAMKLFKPVELSTDAGKADAEEIVKLLRIEAPE